MPALVVEGASPLAAILAVGAADANNDMTEDAMTPRTWYFVPNCNQLIASPALNLGSMGVVVNNVLIPQDAAHTQASIEERIGAVAAKLGSREWYLGMSPHHSGRSLVDPDDATERNRLIRNLQWVAAAAVTHGARGLLWDAEPIWDLVGWTFWPTEAGSQGLGVEMRDAIRSNGRGALEIGCYAPWTGSHGVSGLAGFREWFMGLTNVGMSSSYLFFSEDYITGQTYRKTGSEIQAAFHCTYLPGCGLYATERLKRARVSTPVPLPTFRERLEKQLARARRNSLSGRAWLFPWGASEAVEWTIEHPTYTRIVRALA